ncbi:hypothetical protein [Halomonas salifodinae]|uniref:hypothetical protein n=1 Tax=Halomonas salifodinae TaxID=438745 RepID=UPI0033B8F497
MMHRTCIIIDACLMATWLPRQLPGLRHLHRQHGGQLDIHVISESTQPRLRALSRRFGLALEVVPEATAGARGNRVVQSTQSDLLLFPSPQYGLPAQWFARLAASDDWDALLFAPPSGGWRPLQRFWRTPVTGTLCVRRDWFERLGGFDPALDSEAPQDLLARLRACHARIRTLSS